MISKVSIKQFKCLRDVKIDLERFTFFVGPNSSGKTSILHGADLLCHGFRTPQDQTVEAEFIKSKSRGSEKPVEVISKSDDIWYRYRTRTGPFQVGFSIPPHVMPANWKGEGLGFVSDLASNNWKPWVVSDKPCPLPRSVLLRLATSNLLNTNPIADPTVMASDGLGLHSALSNMVGNDPDAWHQLQIDLRKIIPTIKRIRFTEMTSHRQPVSLLFDTVGGESLAATDVSEGTLLVLGLLAALHVKNSPSLMLLDDLDRGLHPLAQKELISLFRGLLETKPDLQILATTHSPYMLDCMETKEVRMTLLRDDGSTVCAPLTSHPKFKKWKDEMTPGEMWSLFGEKWLVENREAAS